MIKVINVKAIDCRDNIMIKTEDKKFIQKIAEELLKQDTILYIGSGVSCWSGLPSWSKLLKDLSAYVAQLGYSNKHIDSAISNGKYLHAASLSKKQLTLQEYASFMKKEINNTSFQPSILHEAIVQLGCNNYVTTNYDKLLEKTLQKFGRMMQVISSKNLVELPMINRLDAHDYVFKAHGDVDDIDSIIFTREDYAKLYSDTSKVAQTLKTMLLTKTVIFIGFGLSDPDFDYIRDKITTTYGGSQIVHYAIMPDMEEDEKRYWKEQYNIRILSYQTLKNGLQQDHSGLLELIQELGEAIENYRKLNNTKNQVMSDSLFQLSLMKYLSKVEHENSFHNSYPIGVKEISIKRHGWFGLEQDIDVLFKQKDKLIKIIARPGMGKTFALKQYCSRLAQIALHKILTTDEIKENCKVPLYIDMKYYGGSIQEMINRVFPESFGVSILFERCNLVIVLDSINEVPTKYWTEHQFKQELLSYINSHSKHPFYLVSRTGEELEYIESRLYEITGVSDMYLSQQDAKGILHLQNYEEQFLLHSPLFLSFYEKNKMVSFKANDFYQIYIKKLEESYEQEYHILVDFVSLLQSTAYNMIREGTEIIAYQSIVELLKKGGLDENSINWLIDQNRLFIAGIDHQLQFFHQSITEFLAAQYLTAYVNQDAEFINTLLQSTRWDYVIQLVSAYLEDTVIDCIFSRLLEVDCILAMRASAHLEKRKDAVAQCIADYLVTHEKYINYESGMHNAIINVPFSQKQIDQLLLIVEQDNMYSTEIITVISNLYGEESVTMFVPLYVKHVNDFNLATQLARELIKYPFDIEKIFRELKQANLVNSDAVSSSMGILLKGYSWGKVIDWVEGLNSHDIIKYDILQEVLCEKGDNESNNLCIMSIKNRKQYAVFPFYLNCNKGILSWKQQLSPDFFDALEGIIITQNDYWGIELLDKLYGLLPDLEEIYEQRRYQSTGIIRLIYTYCLRKKEMHSFLLEFKQFLLKEEESKLSLVNGFCEVDYKDTFDEIIGYVLDRKNKELLKGFLNSIREHCYPLSDEMFGKLMDAVESDGEESWINYLIGERIGLNMTPSIRANILKQFNENCRREFLLENVLRSQYIDDLQRMEFTEESIQYLLAELLQSGISRNIICQIFNDDDVNKIFIPLFHTCESESAKSNVLKTIRLIGQKYQKRYLDV